MTLITFAILWMSAFSLQAGIRIGAKAGLNLANASFSTDAIQSDNFTGFQVGPILEFSTLSGFGVDAAVLYSQQGLKFKGTSITNESEEKVSTLNIPVNLKMKFSLASMAGVYVSAGPYISFKLDDQLSINNEVSSQWENKNFGVGLNFGAGVELLKHLQVGANYQFALNDDYSSIMSASDNQGRIAMPTFNAKTRIWSITATYFF